MRKVNKNTINTLNKLDTFLEKYKFLKLLHPCRWGITYLPHTPLTFLIPPPELVTQGKCRTGISMAPKDRI